MVDFRKILLEERAKAAETKAATPKKSKSHQVPDDYVPPPELHTFKIPAKIQNELAVLMSQHLAITEMQATLKTDKEDLTAKIKQLCIVYSLDRFQTSGMQTTKYTTSRQTLDKALLLAQGISPKQIIKATRVTETVSVRISAVREESDQTEREDYEYD